jgi:hypothetical protein
MRQLVSTSFVFQARSVSPAGGSTLTTSAPKSAITWVRVLPATSRERIQHAHALERAAHAGV